MESSSPSPIAQEADSVSRRSVVLAAAPAASFMIMAPQTVRGYQANSQVSIGLIGSGGRGTFDTKVAASDPRARITALCDPFPDRLDKAASELKLEQPKTFRDHQKLLADSTIDAVIIASPPFLHPEQLEHAVEAKKHIYCEKPMGVDVKGIERVIRAAKKCEKNKNISVGFQQRYGGVYVEAFKRLKGGSIGDLVNARGFWISSDPFVRRPYDDPKIEKLRNWFCYKDYSGDFIVEQDCHNFDVLHWFLDAKPISVVGKGGRKVRTSMDIMDHLTLSFEFPNGINVNFEANQLTPRGWSRVGEEFTGTTGVLETSRGRMRLIKGPRAEDREEISSPRDITYDALTKFLDNVTTGNVENVAERSAVSTLFAILGRTALYEKREATWKGEFGALGV